MKKNTKKLTIASQAKEAKTDKAMNELTIFREAILKKDLGLLESVLHEQFNYIDDKNKWATLAWFKEQFAINVPDQFYSEEVAMSFCMACEPGNTALVFHQGWWPVPEKDFNIPKAIRIDFMDGMISGLTVCYRFCSDIRMRNSVKEN